MRFKNDKQRKAVMAKIKAMKDVPLYFKSGKGKEVFRDKNIMRGRDILLLSKEPNYSLEIDKNKIMLIRQDGNWAEIKKVTLDAYYSEYKKNKKGEIKNPINKSNLVNYLMDYESGNLDDIKTILLFQYIAKNRMEYTLQGHYGRTLLALKNDGWINRDNTLNMKKVKDLKSLLRK